MRERVVIFANSHKHQQHCVAGKLQRDRSWVRPVANRQGAELSHDQVQYKNPYGTFSVKPLQIIEMEFAESAPLPNQPENQLITDYVWQQRYRISLDEIAQFEDHPQDLWGNGDRVSFHDITVGSFVVQQSLNLVRVEELHLHTKPNGKRRARFVYGGIVYDLAVTDPNFEKIVRSQTALTNVICVSLGENYHGGCYKIVATVFTEQEGT